MRKRFFVSLIVLLSLAGIFVGGFFLKKEAVQEPAPVDGSLPDVVEESYPFVIDIDGATLSVAIADTQEKRDRGLSGVFGLAQDEGMLFIFEGSGVQEIDIASMEFPVDILWLNASRAILDSEKQVRSRIGRRTIESADSTKYAVMMSSGWIEARGTHRGAVVTSESIPSFASLNVPPEPSSSDTQKTPVTPSREPDDSLPQSVLQDVPFTPQAAFGNWNDIRQSNACEEASVLMAYRWAQGQDLSRTEAEKIIIAMSDYELKTYGHFHDTSAQDTVTRIFNDYLDYDGVSVRYDIDFNDIRSELADGNLVIVPADGRKLANPYYTAPGPPVHMLVVIGYDDATGEFITNDPGTKRGASFRYKYAVLENAIGDYVSGYKEPGPRSRTAMIVVRPNE